MCGLQTNVMICKVIDEYKKLLKPNDIVFIKASNFMKLSKIVTDIRKVYA